MVMLVILVEQEAELVIVVDLKLHSQTQCPGGSKQKQSVQIPGLS